MAGEQAASAAPETFDSLNARLREIAERVGDSGMPIDEALDLLDEAVSLGLAASSLLEEGLDADARRQDAADDAGEVE